MFSSLIAFSILIFTQPDDPIVITADGNVEGTHKIQRSGDLFTLTGNIETPHHGGAAITILRDNITMDGNGFSITNNAGTMVGIALKGRTEVIIKNTRVENFNEGILITNSTRIEIYNCSIRSCGAAGISIGLTQTSTALTISHNNITENQQGIQLIGTYDSDFTNNYIAANNPGINMMGSHNNTITQNLFYGNTQGAVRTSGATNNTICQNSFVNNTASGIQVSNPWLVMYSTEANLWDNGFEGNYWSDFKHRYPNASEVSGTGIWDTNYHINEKNIDHYPLVNPYSSELGMQKEQGLIFDWKIIVPIAIILASILIITAIYLIKKGNSKGSIKKEKKGL